MSLNNKVYNIKNDIFNQSENKNPNIKFKYCIKHQGSKILKSNLFEIYKSYHDNLIYISIPDNSTNNLDIFSLNKDQITIYKTLKGHMNEITILNYYINDKKLEYLLSTDTVESIIIWDITHNYILARKIETNYYFKMYSNLLLFSLNKDEDYIITTCSLDEINDINNYNINDSYSRVYSFTNGNFIKNISGTNLNFTYYILSWVNILDNNNYIIEFCKGKIFIYNIINDELYTEFFNSQRKANFYKGFIYTKNNNDYLLSGTDNGKIFIWNLNSKILFNIINLFSSKYQIYHINKWNEKYFYIYEFSKNSIMFINFKELKIVSCFKFNENNNIEIVKVKNLLNYGKCLLISNEENNIQLWG